VIAVFVPAPGKLEAIIRGSGIVGTFVAENEVLIDFEGNRYGAVNLQSYGDRVRRAYERHKDRYPTVARMVVRPAALRLVGHYDPGRNEVRLEVGGDELVRQWLDEPESD
jgi:hypothetical protein